MSKDAVSQQSENSIYVVKTLGGEKWYKDAKHTILHRVGGPAVIAHSRKEWWVNGLLHRVDGPAVVDRSVPLQEWYFNGVLHRLDGPARIDDYNMMWYRYGKRHRFGGPAHISLQKVKQRIWYIDDKKHHLNVAAMKNVNQEDYYKKDELHREGGRASYNDRFGGKGSYYLNGLFVRDLNYKRQLEALL